MCGHAAAQEADQQPSDDATLLEKIMLLGEKFPRDIFNTFTSVEFVTAEELDDYVRLTLGEALNSSPNIRVQETYGNTSISIRGISAEGPTQPNRSNPVISVTVDGAEQSIEATRRGSRGVWDVEQVEVLRGPQSTLQGRNALAGSLVIKTKDPTFTPEAKFEGIADTGGLLSGAFAVSAPLIEDQLAFRIAGQISRDENGIRYANPAWNPLGEGEFEEIRGKLLFTPTELPGFKGLFTVSRTHDKPAWNLVSGPNYFARQFVDPSQSVAEFRDTIVNRYIADLSYEFNSDWTIQSVTSFVDTKVKIDSPPSPTFFRDDTRDGGDFSQDVRLTYGSEESDLSGVLGVYAGQFSSHDNSFIDADILGLGFAIPFQRLDARNKSTSVAAYADGRWRFADRWSLLAGGRVLHDKVSARYVGVVGPGLLDVPLDEISSISNTEILPKIGLAFELSDSQNLAFTVNKGYRPGFSELIVGTPDINYVQPETLWAYELAYRSKWFGDRLQINGNVFYYDYTNMQVPVPVPGLLGAVYTYSINAGEAHSYGAELDARWSFDSGLEVFGGVGLLKTRFDQGVLAGFEFPEAPALTASVGGIYKHQSGFFVGGDVSFTDGFYSKGDVRNMLGVDAYTVVNAQAGYETENFKLTAYAKNLLDEKYITGLGAGGAFASLGDARAVGLIVSGRF